MVVVAGNKTTLQQRVLEARQAEDALPEEAQPSAAAQKDEQAEASSAQADAFQSCGELQTYITDADVELDEAFQSHGKPQTYITDADVKLDEALPSAAPQAAQDVFPTDPPMDPEPVVETEPADFPTDPLADPLADPPADPPAHPPTVPSADSSFQTALDMADPSSSPPDEQPLPMGKKQGWASLTSERIRTQLRYRDLPISGLKPALVVRWAHCSIVLTAKRKSFAWQAGFGLTIWPILSTNSQKPVPGVWIQVHWLTCLINFILQPCITSNARILFDQSCLTNLV